MIVTMPASSNPRSRRKSRVRGIGEAVVVVSVGFLFIFAAIAAAGRLRSSAQSSACDRTADAVADAVEAHRILDNTYPAHLGELQDGRFFESRPGIELVQAADRDQVSGPGWYLTYRLGPAGTYVIDRSGCDA